MATPLLPVEQAVFVHQSQMVADRRLTQTQVLRELSYGHLLTRTAVDHAEQLKSGRVGHQPQGPSEGLCRGPGEGFDMLEPAEDAGCTGS